MLKLVLLKAAQKQLKDTRALCPHDVLTQRHGGSDQMAYILASEFGSLACEAI